MSSHEMCLAVLSDMKLRIRQVEQRHFLVLPVTDVWGSDRTTASFLLQNHQQWQLRSTMGAFVQLKLAITNLKVKMHFKEDQTMACTPLIKIGARLWTDMKQS